MSQEVSKNSLCPSNELIEDYKNAVSEGKTLSEMSADDTWVKCHSSECPTCKNKL